MIGLDGCFLKTYCRGELLSAVGRDGNNQMFPIAWAVVESENKDSWSWFLKLLIDDIGMEDGAGLTVITDQQKVHSMFKFTPKCHIIVKYFKDRSAKNFTI